MQDKFFSQFRIESLRQLKKLKPEDIVLFDSDIIPTNYTLVLRPNADFAAIIKKLYDSLQQIDPNQYYYSADNLHLTIIGNLPLNINVEALIEAIDKEIQNFHLIFNMRGLGSNGFCSSISAYPDNFSLHKLRQGIRNRVQANGDNYSSILESYEYVGWVNYMRYMQIPSQDLLDLLYSYRDTNFGDMEANQIQLLRNSSRVLDKQKFELVHTFDL